MTGPLDPRRVPLRGSRLIEASAGTGKTWTIAALYLRLVLGHGAPGDGFGRPLVPSEILVMTFTRAATRELSDRIRGRLVEAAACFRGEREPAAGDTLIGALLADHPDDAVRMSAAWRLAAAAEAMDDAAVYTIDAWVQRMLREHAFDSGSLFDEAVQPDDDTLVVEAARDYWRCEVYPLSGAALDAVLAVWRDVDALIVDVRRLLPLVTADVDGETLGALWNRLDGDVVARLGPLKAPWRRGVDALRAWLEPLLRSPAQPFHKSRMKPDTVRCWLDGLERWAGDPHDAAVPEAIDRLSPERIASCFRKGCAVPVPPVFDAFATTGAAVVAASAALVPPSQAMRRHAAASVGARVQRQKARIGTFGFDDMLRRLDAALAGPRGAQLRARIVAQYPAALIDEFQDTSPLQYRIFDRLYRMTDDDPETTLLLIGDPKQSIYRFRGADIRSYLRARAATAGRHHVLTTNYRATGALVGAVNHLFETGDELPDGAFRFGRAGSDADDRALPFVPVTARGRLETATTSDGPLAALTLCHDAELASKSDARRRFAGHAAERIARLLDDRDAGFATPDGGFVRLRPADVTVLVRDRHEASAMRRALGARRVPSVFLSDQNSVFASDEAADLLHWLRAVAEPLDPRRARVAFATRLVGMPFDALARLGHDDVAFEARMADLKALHAEWRRHGVLPMLRGTLHRLALPGRWLAQPDGERRLTNYLHVAELLQTASVHLDGEQALIRWLDVRIATPPAGVDEQLVRLESDADLVRVLTIHVAKGLEYPLVFVPFACSVRDATPGSGDVAVVTDDAGVSTLRFGLDDDAKHRIVRESDQEDVRLLYVALTRARHALWLGVSPMKHGHGKKCGFSHSAFGYLVSGGQKLAEAEIAARLHAVFDGVRSTIVETIQGDAKVTPLVVRDAAPPLREAPDYAATFERDWSIGSFSGFVRDLRRSPAGPVAVAPEVAELLLEAGADRDVVHAANTSATPSATTSATISATTSATTSSSAPRHRFPRGALPGNFLHDQLEWLGGQRFAIATDPALREQLVRRCDRAGWGHRAGDVVAWLADVTTTVLPPFGRSLADLPLALPEMEFWFPSDGIDATSIDALCRRHLLAGRERPALPARSLHGMLMGFTDLVCEVDGRYWVVDYKSNALGDDDAAYHADALAASMASHRYDVQGAVYLLALHRLLRQRLGDRYDPDRDVGGAVYLFLRGIRGPAAGCCVVPPSRALLDALDAAFSAATVDREPAR